jgi:hypothetical protein
MAAAEQGWTEQAAAEGAAVSADPGESGDPALAPPNAGERTFATVDSDPSPDEPAPSNHLGASGDPVEGGSTDESGFSAGVEPDAAEPSPSNHLTGGGDPVEGKR